MVCRAKAKECKISCDVVMFYAIVSCRNYIHRDYTPDLLILMRIPNERKRHSTCNIHNARAAGKTLSKAGQNLGKISRPLETRPF